MACRTLADFVIALGHIITVIFHLSKAKSTETLNGCKAIGVINEIALIASNMWYVMLAVDLLKAIRNPFRYNLIILLVIPLKIGM